MDLTSASSQPHQRASRPPQEVSSILPPLAALRTAASDARAHVRSTLAVWQMSHLSDTVQAIVSELVANAVSASADERGQPVYRNGRILLLWVGLHADDTRILAEVWDQAPGMPVLRNPDPTAESGRGLAMVSHLSSAWGWYPARDQPGKCVWAEITTTPLPMHPPEEPCQHPSHQAATAET